MDIETWRSTFVARVKKAERGNFIQVNDFAKRYGS
jgi:hypothetical protein